MKIVHTVAELQQVLSVAREAGKQIGFVPTMGALHNGHASLVKESVHNNDITAVSIFVNPTQFNDSSDLEHYPRTFDADVELLSEVGADIIFAPSPQEMYPTEDTRQFDYDPLDKVMEGAMRPGHFNGVCQIVSKLLEAAKPNRAYFGEKDFQQLAIIRRMVRELEYPVEIVGCPIVREADGLALSSRNMRMNPEERKTALNISATLRKSINFAASHSVVDTLAMVQDSIAAVDGLELEYFQIVDGDTLQPVANWDDSSYIVGCITVFCGPVRLIDNICYKK